ncbi:MAG TPA: TIGR00266 family protein [Candidatus Competibacter sp.]|nr:TIGR00266 family protein [Candidatus Competibacter sp.]
MPTFTITGDIDPFLHATLRKGEKMYCESGAMVMMEATLDLQGKMSGGLGSALMRRLAGGESFFQQHIEATRGDGDCLLSPMLPGAIQMLEVGPQRYTLNDGAFVAASAEVQLAVRTQNLGNALFGQSGGFFVLEASGKGQLAVSGFGSIFMLEVEPGKEVIIDNAHVIAWDSSLHYEISVTTAKAGSGLLGNLLNSVTSGEGVVLRFSGNGKVLICSRNRDAFLAWARTGAGG